MAIKLSEKQIKDGWQIIKFGEIARNISQRVEPSETDLPESSTHAPMSTFILLIL